MDEERPILTNYAIGLLLVMGFHMLFNGASVLLYPDIFSEEMYDSVYYQWIFVGLGIWEFLMAVLLYLGSGLAYKATTLFLFVLLVMTITNMVAGGRFGFDIWIQTLLGGISFAILEVPRVKRFYDNWSLGHLPDFSVD